MAAGSTRQARPAAAPCCAWRSQQPPRFGSPAIQSAPAPFGLVSDPEGARCVDVYVRAAPEAIAGVRELLGATANPQHPEEVEVSRPSDALEARAAAKTAFTSLFSGSARSPSWSGESGSPT